ncbi:MAG: peptidase C15 [Leptolyngbya sp. SIO1E4]|nr:peptidase C15 [Leptolyngbya sp. SIO1E4]
MASLLLTSFAPWRAHQRSNTSDDLVALLQSRNQLPEETVLMRHLPVHFQLAPCQVIATVAKTRPSIVVCCGMAEQRSLLTLERYARQEGHLLETDLPLPQLCQGTRWTHISDDAGSYVCNHLYYQLLGYGQKKCWPIQCLFVHVPLLTEHNRELIAQDFALILSRLKTSEAALKLTAA